MVGNGLAREKIVRLFERKRFWEFNRRILPSLPDRWKTYARTEPRRDHHDPICVESPNEAHATFCEGSAHVKREIFATLEKIRVTAAKLQDLLCQKQFDPAIRPRFHEFSRSRARQRL